MIIVNRWYQDDCTIGRLSLGDFHCFTLELPYLNNQKNISCIPDGTYEYFYRNSSTNGKVLELRDVDGDRTFIQFHAGNFTSDLAGCILPGDSVKYLNDDNIPDVTNSKNTLAKLMMLAGDKGEVEFR